MENLSGYQSILFHLLKSVKSVFGFNKLVEPSLIIHHITYYQSSKFFPISLEILSKGHFFIPSMIYIISPCCNLPKLYLLTISSLSNLYTFLIIVNIIMQVEKVAVVTGSSSGIG